MNNAVKSIGATNSAKSIGAKNAVKSIGATNSAKSIGAKNAVKSIGAKNAVKALLVTMLVVMMTSTAWAHYVEVFRLTDFDWSGDNEVTFINLKFTKFQYRNVENVVISYNILNSNHEVISEGRENVGSLWQTNEVKTITIHGAPTGGVYLKVHIDSPSTSRWVDDN